MSEATAQLPEPTVVLGSTPVAEHALTLARRSGASPNLLRLLHERIVLTPQPLHTHNGRDNYTDAIQGVLDLLLYLTKMRLERDARILLVEDALKVALSMVGSRPANPDQLELLAARGQGPANPGQTLIEVFGAELDVDEPDDE